MEISNVAKVFGELIKKGVKQLNEVPDQIKLEVEEYLGIVKEATPKKKKK